MITVITQPDNIIWDKASEKLFSLIRLFHKITKKTLILLSGGSAINVYQRLIPWLQKTDLDLSFLAFGQVDERFQPNKKVSGIKPVRAGRYQVSSINNINAEEIGKTGFWDICREKKIPYYIISQKGTLEESARQYDELLGRLIREYTYIISVLGIGEDGHTAGLLPGYEKKWDINSYCVGYENNGKFPQRITVTPKFLKETDYTIVTAVGAKKEKAIRLIISEKKKGILQMCPGVVLQEMENVQIFTDLVL